MQLEQRQQQEMYEHRKALEREFESQMHTFDKEMEKLKTKHRQELESKVCLYCYSSMFHICFVFRRRFFQKLKTC